jgi:cobyrinic acid a,c-diamide synthase
VVLGCQQLDPELEIGGVVLNRVGTARQEALIRRAVEESTGIPVLGAIPRLAGDDPLPGRHLGLVTVAEHPQCERSIEVAAGAVAQHVDLEQVVEMARQATPVELPLLRRDIKRVSCRVGYLSDSAFSFYYPENLECLHRHGATLVEVVPDPDGRLPDVDALYIGGGFPEVHAERLAGCRTLADDLRTRVSSGMPVYAECGGLMYLGRELHVDGATYPMAGVLDLVVEQRSKPQGHGYEVAVVDHENPFFQTGTRLVGHEFHYSRVIAGEDAERTVLSVERGCGVGGARDGIVKGSVWASYLHQHALATPGWSEGFLNLAACHHAERSGSAVECV